MTQFSHSVLELIESTQDLYVAPFREDGATYGTFTQVWAVIVEKQVYVRAASGSVSSWNQAAIREEAGRIRVRDQIIEAMFVGVNNELEPELASKFNQGYQKKYNGMYFTEMSVENPTSAMVKISPAKD